MRAPDDITVNDYLTINRGPIVEQRTMMGEGFSIENKSLNGSILRVRAINFPYIAVDILYPKLGGAIHTIPLDIREYEFDLATPEYVQALCGGQSK